MITATTPREQSKSRHGEGSRTGIGRWVVHWHLAILAVLAWVFTVTGLMMDHAIGAPALVVTGTYALAYLCGGTLATKDAIADLLDRQVNVDLLMVLAAAG